MNQGGNVPAVASQNPIPAEITSGAPGYASYYSSIPAYDTAAWGTQRKDSITSGTVTTPNTNYNYAQPTETQPKAVQGTVNVAYQDSLGSGTSLPQEYTSYPPYQSSTDPYSYSNAAHQSYYNNYQQQSTHASSQLAGAFQNLGAPHQPISSFQNSGSYAEPATYSSSYYNPGDYQTSSGSYQNQTTAGGYQNQTTAGSYQNQTAAGGYQSQTTAGVYQSQTTAGVYQSQNASGGYPLYHIQTNVWNGGAHANYSSQQQTYHAPDSNSAYSSTSTSSTAAQYQLQYAQWEEYYNQAEVSCAPGTEHMSKTAAPNPGYAFPGVSSAYSTTVTQQPQPVIPPSRLEPNPTDLTASQSQTSDVGSGVQDTYWQHTVPGFQNQQVRPHVDYQNLTDTNPSYNSFQDSQKTTSALGPNSQYMFVQKAPTSYQPPQQNVPSADPCAVSNIQIPTNPRIASNLPFKSPKINKSHPTNAVAAKPSYISVSTPKSNEKTAPSAAESSLKPGVFPKSLRGYVERALARCKDDKQKAASQAVLTEIITKASADGTLHTRDWDTEPLFAMPESSTVNFKFHTSSVVPSPTQKGRPTRRSKSRWEPVQEEKPADKPAPVDNGMFKYGGWVPSSDSNNKFQSVNLENREEKSSNFKFKYDQKSARKNGQMQFKRQRLNESVAAGTGDTSSDSDKEQSLTAYYSGAITLADTPEEKQRRESRSKRFEGLRHQPEANHVRQRPTAEKQLYSRRARELTLSKIIEESTSTAVEDIDWDALTVKGTSQEIEKRYLRLTCAPDPASVRPEEILEIALAFVQNSKKNYLYKCDQLKSIRQDLTVQRIRNRLTVQVYETHARLALEVGGDLPEYNQCQSQLQSLYADGIDGSYMEFSAYNLLCVMLHSKNTRDLVSAMSRLSFEAKKDEAVKHALAVRTAVTSGNYVLFFKLLKSAPKLHACLMDIYVEKMRFWAIKCMSRSYRPTVPVSYISQVLGFSSVMSLPEGDTNDSGGIEECSEWLKAHGAVLTAANNGDMQLDTKGSSSSLFMPEPEDAVPHGDANLAVNDFFTRAS